MKRKNSHWLYGIALAHFVAVTDKEIVGQKNNEVSKPFMYEIYNRSCRLNIETKEFQQIQSFDLSHHELENIEIPNFNSYSQMFFFEETKKANSTSNIPSDQLAMLPMEYGRGNFWFYLTLREYAGEKVVVENVVQAGMKLVPNASMYLYGKKKNYRLVCK